MKKTILLLVILLNSISFAITNNDIESLKYRKEKSVDIEIYFPKKIPDYLDNILNYNDKEGLYELAKTYLFLDKPAIAEKYITQYEKISKDYLKIAKFYYVKGDAETGDKYINLYISGLGLDERLKDFETIRELIKKYGIIIDESKIYVSNLELLLTSQSDSRFMEIYTGNNWTTDEKKTIALYLSVKDLEKSIKMKDIFYTIADADILKKYYFGRIKNIFDVDGYYTYFQHGDAGEYKYEIKNTIEKIIYLKYKNNNDEYAKAVNEEKENAISENDYEKLYILSKVENSGTIEEIYNLAMQNEKYCYILLKDIASGQGRLAKGSDENINLINYYILTYPLSPRIDEVYGWKIDLTKDMAEKQVICDDILAKRFVYNIFIKKLNVLNTLLKFQEAESLGKTYLENNYPFKECVNEVVFAMEKQEKQKEIITLLDSLSEKGYYYEYSDNTKSSISQREKAGLAEYYFNMKQYSKLVQMKEYLNYEQLNYLIENGKIEFKEYAAQTYPFELKWNDVTKQQYIYFNKDFSKYDENIAAKIEAKGNKTDAEKYYLARYYAFKKEFQKSLKMTEEIFPRYRIYKEITELYIEVLKGSGNNSKAEEIRGKNAKILQW